MMDPVLMKKRRNLMMVVNVLAALGALAGIVGYFEFDVSWALFVVVGALLVGFGAQIWFIAGLRGSKGGA